MINQNFTSMNAGWNLNIGASRQRPRLAFFPTRIRAGSEAAGLEATMRGWRGL